ncbi:hypothetical protein [Deinococcus radiopugnans]|nr:hypothetical protein [Deinococcus radiopugnans]
MQRAHAGDQHHPQRLAASGPDSWPAPCGETLTLDGANIETLG